MDRIDIDCEVACFEHLIEFNQIVLAVSSKQQLRPLVNLSAAFHLQKMSDVYLRMVAHSV
jgi:hypothetical protein